MLSFFCNCLTINGFYFAPSPETEGRCFASKVNESSLKQEKPQEGEQQGGEQQGGEQQGGEQQRNNRKPPQNYGAGAFFSILSTTTTTGDNSDNPMP